MCHHLESLDELSEAEKETIRAEHSESELRAEYSSEELEELGVTG